MVNKVRLAPVATRNASPTISIWHDFLSRCTFLIRNFSLLSLNKGIADSKSMSQVCLGCVPRTLISPQQCHFIEIVQSLFNFVLLFTVRRYVLSSSGCGACLFGNKSNDSLIIIFVATVTLVAGSICDIRIHTHAKANHFHFNLLQLRELLTFMRKLCRHTFSMIPWAR